MVLDELLFNVPCPIFWKDKNSIFLGCNKFFLPVCGFKSTKQLIGKSDAELPWKEFKDKYKKDDEYVIKTGETIKVIENIQLKNRMIISETTKTPLIQNGKTIGVLGICIDITDRQEKEFLKAKNSLYQEHIKNLRIFEECLNDIQHTLQSAKMKTLQAISGKKFSINKNEQIKLTEREGEILYLLSLGKQSKEISQILSNVHNKKIAPSTIAGIINKNLYTKFDVFNCSLLIEKAYLLNMIPFLHKNFTKKVKDLKMFI